MVKVLFLLSFLFLSTNSFANGNPISDILMSKIKLFLDEKKFNTNKAYIDILFSPRSDYIRNNRVDSVKVIETLKENGLLNLYFKKPTNLRLNFKTSSSVLFFIKIMGDTLRNIGYYRYVTKDSTLDNSEFIWSINLSSEYATDPLVLQNELMKSGCFIIDIDKNSPTEWSYTIDMRNAHLNVPLLTNGSEVNIKRSLYAHWLNISKITRLEIRSSRRNNWYPKISYYNNSLHLIKVISTNKKVRKIILNIPKDAQYIKISDIYTLKNVKDPLILKSSGSK